MQMNKDEIRERLKYILLSTDDRYKEVVENCTDESDLINDFGFTSVMMLYIVISIEESFNIRFEDVGVADLKTLGGLIGYIYDKV